LELETETAENRKLHEQLLQTQKLDAVGTMASGIAHDFNNSLAVITGFAEIAKTTSSDSHEFIDHILTAAKQATGTTRDLLTFSRGSLGEKVPRDFTRLVRETSDFLRKMMPASIKLSGVWNENATVWCSIDTAHIQQVLVNVVMNARDVLPDGGEISISAGPHAKRLGFAQLVISDNGTGMPEQVRERIFDPFFTTKSRGRGTGLGMAIVHGIIEDHQGTIEIESSPEQGTTVSITLPQCRAEESRSELPEPVLRGLGETILVVEDNREVQTMIEAQLRSANFDVLTANDGEQALRLLHDHASKVRLALLDIDLPNMDGKACLREIRAKFPHLPAIMMSGLSSVDPAQLGTPFLRKPFDRKTLISTINLALQPEPVVEQATGVLVIDDDDLVRMSTKAVLASSSLDVYLAASGAEAVCELRENLDRIGTVLLDWNIPQADPELILQELRNVSPQVRVLVVSGDLTLQPQQVQAKGFARLLRKPVSSRELMEAVG
jgi:CheY-like chemotaxis protein